MPKLGWGRLGGREAGLWGAALRWDAGDRAGDARPPPGSARHPDSLCRQSSSRQRLSPVSAARPERGSGTPDLSPALSLAHAGHAPVRTRVPTYTRTPTHSPAAPHLPLQLSGQLQRPDQGTSLDIGGMNSPWSGGRG